MSEDEELLEHLRRQANQERKHATFFSWHDRSAAGKGIAEAGAVKALFEAMASHGQHDYSNARPSNDSWPDCIADDQNGAAIAFEVTELVDEAALPDGIARPWPMATVGDRLQDIVSTKDQKSFGGGKYREVVLLIHTDELYADPDAVTAFLKSETFTVPHGILTRAFLLFSYDPKRNGYPFVEMRLVV